MKLVVHKTSALHGCVLSPSSKSDSIRALFCALLAAGESTISNLLMADDTAAAIHVCQQLGAEIICDFDEEQSVLVRSNGAPFTATDSIIYSNNSGLSTHFVLPLLGLRQNPDQRVTLDCGEQMRARPVQPLIAALRLLGMNIDYVAAPGKLPLTISGQLLGGNACVDGTTSQYLSALLLALPCAERDSEIVVKQLAERPYVTMTLEWLQRQNIRYEHHCGDVYDTFWIPGKQRYTPFARTISGDFSSMATVIAAAVLLPGEVQLLGLDMLDAQGDKQL
ncbi:MAG: 3-phosphoshikimate 1-carboxyvinyltransferase, partial [Gammaproteobacteria bacterium]|nr:3-phosphoshikimate 1-carboxyvinyltransferase [Gammaproteobacteria bacterium]